MFIETITPREKEILTLIAKELTAKEIAVQLFISLETVKTHRSNLLSKMDARNTAGLIVKSIKYRILPLAEFGFSLQ
jgi:DNA-binding CsgD family transcriptional regulator